MEIILKIVIILCSFVAFYEIFVKKAIAIEQGNNPQDIKHNWILLLIISFILLCITWILVNVYQHPLPN